MKPIRVSIAALLFVLALGGGSVAAQPRDPASLAPADALVCAGWTKLNDGNWEVLKALEALLAVPEIAEEMEVPAEVARPLMRVIDGATRASVAFVVLPPTEKDGPPWVNMGLIVAAGEASAELLESFETFVKASNPPSRTTEMIDGVEFQSVPAPDFPLRWASHAGHLILALSEPAARALLARAQGKDESLADAAGYKADAAKLGPAGGDWCFSAYGDMKTILSLATAAAGDGDDAAGMSAVFDAMGVNKLGGFLLRADATEYGPRLAAFLRTGGAATGLFKLYQQAPLTDDDLKLIPSDAYWGVVWNLDLAAAEREARAVLGKIDAKVLKDYEDGLAEVGKELGFSITEDLLPAFGDTWALLDAPAHGGLLLTGVVIAAETKDADVVQRSLAKIVECIQREATGESATLQLRETKQGAHTIHYVLVAGIPMPIAPAWAFVDGRWVFGLYPQTVAAALTQLDPATRGPSLLDNVDFKAARGFLPSGFTSVSYSDARGVHNLIYALMQIGRAVVASLTAQGPTPFDLAAAPTFAEELAGIRPMVYASATDVDGLIYAGVGVRPLAYLAGGNSGGAASVGLAVSILLPSLSRARELAKRTVCAANLRGVGQGFHIYANEHDDKFPRDMGTLVKEGMITPKQFLCPSSGDTEVEVTAALGGGAGRIKYTYIVGQTGATDPRNVLVYEDYENHNGEGGNVLFADGSVMFLKGDAFRQAVRETYQRLKREAEMPAEFKP